MMERANGLLALIDEYFFEIVDSGILQLPKNKRYERVQNEKTRLFEKYPDLCSILELGKDIALTDKDAHGIRQLISLNNEISVLEMQCCYYKGMKDYKELTEMIESK